MDCIVPDFIDFWGYDWKESDNRLKKINIFICEKCCTAEKLVRCICCELPEHYIE